MKELLKDIRKIYDDKNNRNYSFAISNKAGQKYNLIDRRIIRRQRTSKFFIDDLLIPVDIMVRILHNIMSMDVTNVVLKTLSVDEELLNIMFTYNVKNSKNNSRLIRISIRSSSGMCLPELLMNDNHLSVYVAEVMPEEFYSTNISLGQIFLEDLVNSPKSLSQRIENLIIQKDTFKS